MPSPTARTLGVVPCLPASGASPAEREATAERDRVVGLSGVTLTTSSSDALAEALTAGGVFVGGGAVRHRGVPAHEIIEHRALRLRLAVARLAHIERARLDVRSVAAVTGGAVPAGGGGHGGVSVLVRGQTGLQPVVSTGAHGVRGEDGAVHV